MFKDRDLSWLDFNGRVLQEAQDDRNPLVERLKFLAIYSANLEEFYKVRVARQRYQQQFEGDKKNKFGFRPSFILDRALAKVYDQQEQFGNTFTQHILPGLASEGIVLLDENQVTEEDKSVLRPLFAEQILPLRPLISLADINASTLQNQYVYLYLVTLQGHHLLELPYQEAGRFITITETEEVSRIIQLDDVYRLFADQVLPDVPITGIYAVKISRDAALHAEDEDGVAFYDKIRKSLKKRDTGLAARLLFDQDIAFRAINQLRIKVGLDMNGLVPGAKYHNFGDYLSFPISRVKESLFYPARSVVAHPRLAAESDWFSVLRKKDVLLTFPYQDYSYVVQFLEKAATDPLVTSISITLYRVSTTSAVCQALEVAALSGKSVTVFAEVQARFDEETNLYWGERLEKAGAKVIYSIEGLKVHAKICLIMRQEGGESKYYEYLGTGNFNEKSAKVYTDFGLLTASKSIGQDLGQIFAFLQQQTTKVKGKKLWVSPFSFRRKFGKQLEKEMVAARAGLEAMVTIKLNSLEDPATIHLLKSAADEGVKLRLIVRGICCLVPVSEAQQKNIEIISILGRYLEHARIYCFHNRGNPKIWLASADLMSRNLDRRIEVGFPIVDKRQKALLLSYLQIQWEDRAKSRWIDPEGKNEYRQGEGREAQEALFELLRDRLGESA